MTSLTLLLMAAGGATNASQGVLLDFTATWCGPCRQMSPIVARLARQGYPIRQVDVDRNPALAQRYRITGIPAFVLVVDGKEVTRIVGAASESQLKRLMARIPKHRPKSRQPSRPAASKSIPITGANARSQDAPVRLVGRTRKRFRLPFLLGNREQYPERTIDAPAGTPGKAVIRAKLDPAAQPSLRTMNRGPLAAGTRIRVKDSTGVNFGSGTVIYSKPGRTIILTCGHIFRGLTREATVEVDVFESEKPRTYVGMVIRYDLESDLGLISIPTDGIVPFAKIGVPSAGIRRGDRVFSVGCDSGKRPTKLQLRVTALNRYRGPDNVECTGVPVQGRSGGGLFDSRGNVVGVCFAADPRDRRGLYTGLRPIITLLEKSGLSHLKESSSARSIADSSRNRRSPIDVESSTHGPANTGERTAVIDQAQLALMRADSLDNPLKMGATDGLSATALMGATAGLSSSARRNTLTNTGGKAARGTRANSDSRALKTVSDVFGKSSEAEVICIIRPLNDPQAASRIVIVHRASAKFVEFLKDELRQQPRSTTKSMKFTQTASSRRTAALEPGRYRRSRDSR